MNRHSNRKIILAVAVACFLPSAVPADPAETPPAATASADSASSSPGAALASARAAYQTVWALRESGENAIAVITADQALAAVETSLQGDIDATSRRDLTEIKVRLRGLRDSAQHKVENATFEGGNEADAGVLNSPAMEGIEPQFNEDVYRWIDPFHRDRKSTRLNSSHPSI